MVHHYCFSSLIVKVKRIIEAKLEVSPLSEMNLTFWKREQCVWVQPAEGSLLFQTDCVLCHGGLVCLSSIYQTHTLMHLYNTHIIIRLHLKQCHLQRVFYINNALLSFGLEGNVVLAEVGTAF